MNEQVKGAMDLLSLGTVLATLATWLPPIAALFTIIWTLIRIWESRTVRGIIKRWRCKDATPECPRVCPKSDV